MTLAAAHSATTQATDLSRAKEQLAAEGYCVVENVLSPEQVAALKARLVEQGRGEVQRGVAFRDGGAERPNQRVWMLANKGKAFRDLVLHPIVDDLIGQLLGPDFLLSSLTANIAHPGGEPMVLHTDQGYLGYWTALPVVANIIWMLDDFSDANGGTRLIPKSHLDQTATPRSSGYLPPNAKNQPKPEDTIGAEGKAGSILCFDGRIWHGTGSNRTADPRHALLSYYCRPYIRQQENFTLGLLPAIRKRERPELLKRLGFSIWAGLGRVESPIPSLPLYESPQSVEALAADGTPIEV